MFFRFGQLTIFYIITEYAAKQLNLYFII